MRRHWTEDDNPGPANIARFAPEFDDAQVGTIDDLREDLDDVRREVPSFLRDD
ncbi:MAG: hypothetical protein JO034_30885 [Singulisphaera sp.]|nr:hypothetical protein [Singulisphaera sp.]